MTGTVIVGGQFGSEGKGKVAGYLSSEFTFAARTGGPNSGHTVEFKGRIYQLQSIPSAFVNPTCHLGIGAGGIIDPQILLAEIEQCEVAPSRLLIDPQAVIVNRAYRRQEDGIVAALASTGQGVGIAVAEKVRRLDVTLARDVPKLQPYIGDVAGFVADCLKAQKKIMIEGSQGFWLSLHHGYYPYVTSRDTTAGCYCGEIGLGPCDVGEIILVLRTFPIRVGGNSGPLKNEIDWSTITKESCSPRPLLERTTVTKRVRRIGRFCMEEAVRAAKVNSATQIALNFVDYLDFANFGARTFGVLTRTARDFIEKLENETGRPVTLIGTGPSNSAMIDLRGKKTK